MSADDLNAFLLNTKTSHDDVHGALAALDDSDAWTRRSKGKKRTRAAEHEGIEDGMQQHHHSLRSSHQSLASSTARFLQQSVESGGTTSTLRHQEEEANQEALEASGMAHFVLEYVLVHELGGRVNASKGDEGASIPPTGLVQAERAQLRPVARDGMLYVSRRGGSTRTLLHSAPMVIYQELPDDVIRLRQSLVICDYQRDLVGGVTGQNAPSIRHHLLSLLKAGLLAEKWIPEDTAVAEQKSSQLSAMGFSHTETIPTATLDLFGTVEKKRIPSEPSLEGNSTKNTLEGDDDDENEFSLEKYLHGEDTDEEEES